MSSLDCRAGHVCYFASTHQSHFSLVIGSNTHGSDHILFKSIKEDSTRHFTSVQHDGPNRCLPRAHFNDRGARDAA
ncbi:hypothetical protein TNCV_1835751 [Trichonephila clavipes]|nr:hypothetical protein TNCV_1835751 [Trichonephila clavipes]